MHPSRPVAFDRSGAGSDVAAGGGGTAGFGSGGDGSVLSFLAVFSLVSAAFFCASTAAASWSVYFFASAAFFLSSLTCWLSVFSGSLAADSPEGVGVDEPAETFVI